MTTGSDHHQGRLFDPSPRGAIAFSGRFPELEDALCARVAQLREPDPLLPITIVVGSSLVRRHLGDTLVRRLDAVANVTLLTLAGYARRLAARAPGGKPHVLSQVVRERLLRRAVAEAPALQYFGPVSRRPHFAHALEATVTDLRQAGVDPAGDWTRAVVGVAPDPARARQRRAADLSRLYASYCADLARRGLTDDAAVYGHAADAVRSTTSAPCGRVVLYGLYDLNQVQEQLVVELLGAGADLFVPLPRGAAEGAAPALEAAARCGTPARRLAAPEERRDGDRLAAVWSGTRTAAPLLRLAGDGSLAVVSVPDERGEAREATRALLEAAVAGAPLWDCAVVVPHSDDVERLVATLAAAGLPVACRLPDRSLGSRLVSRLVDCVAPVTGASFGRRAVLDLLTAAPLRHVAVSPGDPAAWVDEARRSGVLGGLDQWADRMARRRRDLEAREPEASRAHGAPADDPGGYPEQPPAGRSRLDATRTLEAAVGALRRAAGGLPQSATWGGWVTALDGVLRELFVPDAAAGGGDTVGRLLALDVLGEAVDAAEMGTVVREQLGRARVPVGRVGREGVAVLTPLEIRGLSFHTVVFTGLAEGGFPSKGRPDPILGDPERLRVGEHLGVRLPLAEDRMAESLLLFGFACEAARRRLVLIAPRTDAATGRPRLPSRVLLRLASLAAGRPVRLDDLLTGQPLRPVWRHVGGSPDGAGEAATTWLDARELDAAALLRLERGCSRAKTDDYLAAVLGDGEQAARRLEAWRAARSAIVGPWDGLLGDRSRAILASLHPFAGEMHPTRLERYLGCPFGFYLRDILGLEAPDEPDESLEMDAREFGTLAHDILQTAFERLIEMWADPQAPPGLDAAFEAVRTAWTSACAEAERRGVTGATLAWEVRRATLLEDLLETVRRDAVFRGHGRPLNVEWRFGEAVERPVALELPDGRRVTFAGRVDRVDATGEGARVIDYKTGNGSAEGLRLRKGLAVQLPVYRLAVRQAGDPGEGEITCVYRLVTRRGGFEDLALTGDEAAGAEQLVRLVTQAVGLVDAGLFPRSREGRCDFCDLGYACGVSAWTRARKREHDALRDVVRLQRRGPGEEDDDAGG